MKEENATYNHTDSDSIAAAQKTADGQDATKKDKRRKFNIFAFLSILLTVVAWVLLTFNGPVSLGVSIVAFICGCFGLKASTRTLRNTAITSLIASAVLMVVMSAFLIVIYIGLNSL